MNFARIEKKIIKINFYMVMKIYLQKIRVAFVTQVVKSTTEGLTNTGSIWPHSSGIRKKNQSWTL